MITLLPHQTRAVGQIRAKGGSCLLVSPAGSGKTYMAGECLRLISERHGGNSLYITEATAINEQVSKLRSCGVDAVATRDYSALSGQTAVISHAVLRIDAKRLSKAQWTAIVVDECHRLENGRSPTAKALIGVGKNMGLESRFKIAMSATPIANGLKDSYTYLRWLHPDSRWTSFSNFAGECLIPHFKIRGTYTGVRNREEIGRMMNEIKVDVDYVPSYAPPKVTSIEVALSPEERAAFDLLRDEMILDLATGQRVVRTPAAVITKMRQMTAHPKAVGIDIGSSKEEALMKVLARRKEGQKAIVFCQFTTVLDVLHDRHGWPVLKGGMTRKAKDGARGSEPDVLLMSPAGEASIDCQWASMVVNYDLPWHGGHLDQRNGRAVREGQTKEVEIVYITASDTYDRQMDSIIKRKIRDTASVIRKRHDSGK